MFTNACQMLGPTFIIFLIFFVGCEAARLVFRPPLHQPRIYHNAPPGVHVTTIHAYDPDAPRNNVTYNLVSETDGGYFALDRISGNMTTAKTIDKKVGETFKIIVIAFRQGDTTLENLEIVVTEFNQVAPQFEQTVYKAEVHVNASIGTRVLRVRAHDADPVAHSAEIYYRMDQNASGNHFLLDPRTGELTISTPLNASEPRLVFGIFAEDGGSPKRWSLTRIEIVVKTISEPSYVQVFNVTDTYAAVCWNRPLHGDIQGYVVKYREIGMGERGTHASNVTATEALELCSTLDELKADTEYELRVYGWNDEEIGQGSRLMKFRTRINCYNCEKDVDECTSAPCQNGGTCRDGINSYNCTCLPGYSGKQCKIPAMCPTEAIRTTKGNFYWNSTKHGIMVMLRCPYGKLESAADNFAKRNCLLIKGVAVWEKMIDNNCKEKEFIAAEKITGQLQVLTRDPSKIQPSQLHDAVEKMEEVVQYAIRDKKLAHSMLTVISNVLAVNDSIMEASDENGTASSRLLQVVDSFVSNVYLMGGQSLTLQTDNIVIKAVPISRTDPRLTDKGLTFSPGMDTETSQFIVDDKDSSATAMISIPPAVFRRPRLLRGNMRVKFIAYKTDRLFRPRRRGSKKCSEKDSTKGRATEFYREDEVEELPSRPVLQASVGSDQVANLSEPVVYVMPSPSNKKVLCVYWKERDRVWSTDGLTTNQSDNITTCMSNHLTAFSILLDPTPFIEIPREHRKAMSVISYVGSWFSIIGLSLTILTYSLFRCLNRDHPGKILLNLCVSLLLMNVAFLMSSFRSSSVCVVVAILTHYFLLTSLSWMCVEAVNMYQLLIHVFASSETHFLLKRCLLAWGGPFAIVSLTMATNIEEYRNHNTYCMLSPLNPYVYYISLLGPSCLILAINLTVFVMVSRVLFTPRMTAKAGCLRAGEPCHVVTAAQVRGAFTVMVLLGVTWVFGAFAVGDAKLVFQYIFCIANSLQGLLIFLVRCLHYPEARSAWLHLIHTGTLKKYRGVVPPGGGSWYTNSNSSNKQNGHSSSSRLRGSDASGTVVFNSNWWRGDHRRPSADTYGSNQPLAGRPCPTAFVLKTTNIEKEQNDKADVKNSGKERTVLFSDPDLELDSADRPLGDEVTAKINGEKE